MLRIFNLAFITYFVTLVLCAWKILAQESEHTFTPLELLCFAMANPDERAKCGNRADTTCLTELMRKDPKKNYNPLHCKSNAVAQVNMGILKKLTTHRCSKNVTDSEDYRKGTVWIAAQVKNDAQTILEWLVWHFLLGVDHALIYDNESSDNLKESLDPFINEGMVELIDFPGVGMQAKAFTDALARAKKGNVDWLAAIDGDEYIVPIVDKCIPDFLQRFYRRREIAGIRLNWQYVTSLGRIWRWENGALDQTLLDRTGMYTGRADYHVKTIARVARTFKFMDSHYAIHAHGTYAVSPDTGKRGTYHFTNPPQTKMAVMLHLHVRTLEEWILKRMRGRGSVKTNHCPYCNSTLEVLVSEWLCLNSGGYGIPDKDGRHKCSDEDDAKLLTPALNNWAKPLKKGLSNAMRKQSKLMHAVLSFPIERGAAEGGNSSVLEKTDSIVAGAIATLDRITHQQQEEGRRAGGAHIGRLKGQITETNSPSSAPNESSSESSVEQMVAQ